MATNWIARAAALTPEVRDFIDGKTTGEEPVHAGQELEKLGPRDGKLLCRYRGASARRVDEAVASARRAFESGVWAKLPAHQRARTLERFADLVDANREELALLECLDVGKPITDALTVDLPAVSARIRFNAAAADKYYGKVYTSDDSSLSYQLRRPYGVVAGIVGWNFPLVLAAEKAAPALAAGNSLVLKPSEWTSLATWRLARLAMEAGVPPGVFNVVHGGAEVGSALAYHRDIDLLTFTGSTRTGRRLLVASGESNMKRTILECGGKAASLVFEDCPDLDSVAAGILQRAYFNQGQVCTASSRLLVHRAIREALLDRLVARAAALRTGDPLDPATKYGALVSRQHLGKVLSYIESGVKSGARIVYQSSDPPPHQDGFYAPRVIFDEVRSDSDLAQHEIFGPVLSVMSFKDDHEAVRLANETIYGLSAIAWTRDIGRAQRLAHSVQAGWIVINATSTPAGGPGPGVMNIGGLRQSGIGAEGGVEGLEAYTTSTAVQMFA